MSGSNIHNLKQKIKRLQREIAHFEAQQRRPGTRPRDQATRTRALHCSLDRRKRLERAQHELSIRLQGLKAA